MYGQDLKRQILTFVKEFQIVQEDQIRKFFSDWGTTPVECELYSLYRESILHLMPGGIVSCTRTLPRDENTQRSIGELIRGLNVLCLWRSRDILECWTQKYPCLYGFLAADGTLCDVTSFSENDWTAKYTIIPEARAHILPPNEPDPVTHIAVVRDMDMIRQIEPLGFSYYAVLPPDDPDGNGEIQLYRASTPETGNDGC